MGVKALQINTNRSQPSLSLALHHAERWGVNIMLISEPPLYKGMLVGTPGWRAFANTDVAILTKDIKVLAHHTGTHTVTVDLDKTRVVGLYASPNKDIEGPLDELENECSAWKQALIVGGDFNCRWSEFTSAELRARDHVFAETILMLDLQIENTGQPTCSHQGRYTTNDYTLTRQARIEDWNVKEDDPLSDHAYITFTLAANEPLATAKRMQKKTDIKVLHQRLTHLPTFRKEDTKESAEENAQILTQWLQEAVKAATTETPCPSNTYWWNKELSATQKKLKTLGRQIHRCTNRDRLLELNNQKRTLRKMYRLEIRSSKEKCWRDFVNRTKPWGKPYKVVVEPRKQANCEVPQIRKADGSLTTSDEEASQLLLTLKFPGTTEALQAEQNPVTPVTEYQYTNDAEITRHLKKCCNRSAPGTDGINYKTLKITNKRHPGLIPWIMNNCLRWRVFPQVWKNGRVIMLPKGKKDPHDAGEYRPITLLSALGKLFERCLAERIGARAEEQLSARQYGFRKGRSCEQCILLATQELQRMRSASKFVAAVAIDISGAFDCIQWRHILTQLRRMQIPEYLCDSVQSYFRDRCVQYGPASRVLQRGTPQGSVLGPLLWNVGYNAVLDELRMRWVAHFCYADDTLLLLADDNLQTLRKRIMSEIKAIQNSLQNGPGLLLSHEKTEILLLQKRGQDRVLINKDNRTLKYLGVYLDENLTWIEHCRRISKKAIAITAKMAAVCRNTFGYSDKARRIMLDGTAGAIIQYASAAFAHRLGFAVNAIHVDRAHRAMLLCCTRAYRSVSYLPATVIGYSRPLKYEMTIHAIITAEKKKLRLTTGDLLLSRPSGQLGLKNLRISLGKAADAAWNREWSRSDKGQWTRELMPTVKEQPGSTNFWLTQGLSGHGVFGDYLHRRNRRASPRCRCGADRETAAHIFRECPRHADNRPDALDGYSMETRSYLEEVVKKLWAEEAEEMRQRPRGRPPEQ